jgi:hypothetical protein
MAISSARQFFDQAVSGGAVFLEKLVIDKTHETEWLDFKGGRDDPSSEQVKGLWSKAICGFANNQGGCIVWGIDARKDPETNVDAANEVEHVKDPAVLRSRLMELHPRATEPPLAGVESVTIYASGNSGPGFVVSYVPESDAKPHRAENLKNTPYMIRIGDSFINPGPSILRNLFYPRSATQLQISVACEWQSPTFTQPPTDMEIWYRLTLKNTSAITARDIFVIVKSLPMGLEINCPYKTTKTDTEFGVGIEVNRVLQPFSTTDIGTMRQTTGVAHSHHGFRPRAIGRMFAAYFQLFANDMIPLRQQVAFGDRDVHERAVKVAIVVAEFDDEFYLDALRSE